MIEGDSMRLKDKVAIVTGAAQGIGGASATLFAREGAKVSVVDVNAEVGEERLRSIQSAGGEAQFIHADVGTEAGIKKDV